MPTVVNMADYANALLHQHAANVSDSDAVVSGYLNRPKRKPPRFTAGSRVYISDINETGSIIRRPEWDRAAKAWSYFVRLDTAGELRFRPEFELEPETTGPDAA